MQLTDLQSFFSGKRVFLTGHTGFKGAWMLLLLRQLGAEVKGYSLAPEHPEDLYNQIGGDGLCQSVIADIRDGERLREELLDFQPDVIFHLAAQAFVRRSYRQPLDTFGANVMGTAHVLDALRDTGHPMTAVIITTDKVYENDERGTAFPETAPLGGYDPYSASKAAAEIVIDAYRRSFFHPDAYAQHQKTIVSMRAGNVIGGGDFSEDRLIPDLVRAIRNNEPVILRNPQSVRPWQHVLEPVVAYLLLAVKASGTSGPAVATAYNIGPDRQDERTVLAVARQFYEAFGRSQEPVIQPDETLHEAKLLMLDNTKLKDAIGWKPVLNADEAIRWTARWYASGKTATEKCVLQIQAYFDRLGT
jgi:CDP-glucose 4,6-dehydratase